MFLWLVAIVSLVYSAELSIDLYLKCERMYGSDTHVFLMEEDAGGSKFLSVFDSDDVLSRGDVNFNELLTIKGNDDEIGDLEPYLFMINRCKKETSDLKIILPHARYRKNFYRVNVNMDTNEIDIVGPGSEQLIALG